MGWKSGGFREGCCTKSKYTKQIPILCDMEEDDLSCTTFVEAPHMLLVRKI